MSSQSNSGNTISKRFPKGMLTTSGLAEAAGVSVSTIKYWAKQGYLSYETVQAGRLTIKAFTSAHVQMARKLATTPGQLKKRSSAD